MKYGIHLPHAGEQATPALICRHAERAEALGLDAVWVSEHIIVPRDKFPRSPLFAKKRRGFFRAASSGVMVKPCGAAGA